MKKIIFAAVTLIFSVSMLAQAPQRGERREFKPEDMATRITDGMKKALDLNDKQYKSVFKLYLKQGEEMKARREKEQGQQIDREARREEMKKSQEAMNAELKKILTAEQYTKYEEMLKRQQQRQYQGGPRGPQGSQGMSPR